MSDETKIIREALGAAQNIFRAALYNNRQKQIGQIDEALAALSRLEGGEQAGERMDGVWRCSSCGDMRESSDPRWRWNGEAWEHKCGDPQAGYFPAKYFGEQPTPPAELWRKLNRRRGELIDRQIAGTLAPGIETDFLEVLQAYADEHLANFRAAEQPTPPVECAHRKALQTARDTIQECFAKLAEIAEAEGRPACDWDTFVAAAPEMNEIDAALSAPCQPTTCPTCAELRAEAERLRAGLRSQAIAGTRHWFYAPCPKCGAIEGMGLSSRGSETVAVYCCMCEHFGPTIEGLSKEADRAAVIAWNKEFAVAFSRAAEHDRLTSELNQSKQEVKALVEAWKDTRDECLMYLKPDEKNTLISDIAERAAALVAQHEPKTDGAAIELAMKQGRKA